MQNRKQGGGLLYKLVGSYSLVFSVIVLALSVFAYRYVAEISRKTAEIHLAQLAEKTASQVGDYLDEMSKMAEQIKSDNRIMNIFVSLQKQKHSGNYFEDDVLTRIDIASILASHNGPSMPIWRINVYNQHGDFIHSGAPIDPRATGSPVARVAHPDRQAMVDAFAAQGVRFLILPPQPDRWSGMFTERYVSFLMPITDYYSSEIYGIIELQQSEEKLGGRIAPDALSDLHVFLFDGSGAQIFPEDSPFQGRMNNSNYSVARYPVDRYGWEVALVQGRESMLQPYRSILVFLLVGDVVLLVVLLVMVYLISKRITRPLVVLSQKVRGVSFGNIPSDWGSKAEGMDEVQELSVAFSSMLKRLTNSIAYEKKAYLQALQSQMNPHFLFNSLSILSSIGMEIDNEEIVGTCSKISEIMRYSSDTRPSTIGREIENLHNYLDLMKLRYEEHFSYVIDAEPALDFIPIARFVLQPIVENCFEHGFKQVPPPWYIHVSAHVTPDGWRITIADNGSGFSEEKRLDIERKVRQYTEDLPANYADMKIGGLGLANTIIRLKFFGGACCTIGHNEPTGTVVSICGGKHDQSAIG
ncbi:MAG: histidine kinase [Oscillospiraceae bacterium]|jgi:sensor histidine kinase YesM|nr:histidine kinase [Oscillospiraceae bacterium]